MRFILFLVGIGWLAATVSSLRPSPFSISPECELIQAKNIDELTANHLLLLELPTRCVLFRLLDSNTFLARKAKRRWNIESSLEKLAKITGRSHFPAIAGSFRSPFLKSFASVGDESPWVEFYYTDFEKRTLEGLAAVSPCHSEFLGEGTVVTFQSVFLSTLGGSGGLNTDFDIRNFVISTTADVTLERAKAISLKVRCSIGQGEVGQLLLANTQYLHYTPWHRILIYDLNANQFSSEDVFTEQPRERRIIKGGIGDWMCVTSSLAELRCNDVASGNTFWT